MIGVLVQIVLLAQVISILPNQGGAVTGVLTSETLRPAPGIRVGAMIQPENLSDVTGATSLVSIAETDESGRFRLENIPPGRYYITAGRVELPTYYPGTTEIAGGRIVTVVAGGTVSGVDFAIKDVSDRGVETIDAMLRIPIQLQIEDGLRIPVFSEHGKVRLSLTHLSDGAITERSLDSPTLTLPNASGEYRVTVENLPDGYVMTSLTYGSINLMTDVLQVTLNDLPKPAAGEQLFLTNSRTGIVLQRRNSSQNSSVQLSSQVIALGSITSTLNLTLALSRKPLSKPAASGVRVVGRVEYAGQQELYISGGPGTLYSDGTFEFRGVAAGRHVVAMIGASSTSRQFGAIVTVGNVDVEGVQLQDLISLPTDVMSPSRVPSDPKTANSSSTLHSIRAHVVAESTHQPVAGIVTFRGYLGATTYSLPADGEFEIPNLLPGSYGVKIETFDRNSLSRTIVVENEDLELQLSIP